jgi:hypothetical protein
MIKDGGFFKRLWRNDLNAEFFTTLAVAIALTLLTYLFVSIELTRDQMVPFRSTGFVLGAGAIFYTAFAYGTRQALYLSAGVSMLVLMVWLDVGSLKPAEMTTTAIAIRWPLVTLFFIGLSVLPNALPAQYEEDIESLAEKNKELDKQLVRLRDQFHRIQQKDVIEKQGQDKKDQVRLSSRTAFLNSFARELLQASSNREVLNLLFHNVTRLLQLDECLMLIVSGDSPEAVVARALHPKHEQLENARVPFDNAVLARAINEKKPISFAPPQAMLPEVNTRFLLPIVSDGNVVAAFSLGAPKGGDILHDDEEFLTVLAAMLAGAMEQLRISAA